MRIKISTQILSEIKDVARQNAPQEACGMLFGDAAEVHSASATKNVAVNPERHFEIDPVAHFAAIRAERAGGPRLIGYWHSHPSGDVRPSATDAAMAHGDGKLWVIVGGDMHGVWQSTPAGFVSVDLLVE